MKKTCRKYSEHTNTSCPVRIHFIIVMIRWTGLAPWEFEFTCRKYSEHTNTSSDAASLSRVWVDSQTD